MKKLLIIFLILLSFGPMIYNNSDLVKQKYVELFYHKPKFKVGQCIVGKDSKLNRIIFSINREEETYLTFLTSNIIGDDFKIKVIYEIDLEDMKYLEDYSNQYDCEIYPLFLDKTVDISMLKEEDTKVFLDNYGK